MIPTALRPLPALIAALLLPACAHAQARDRVFAPALTCAAVRAVVVQAGDVLVATSANAYERVFRDSGACREDVTSAPAFAPTSDDPVCFTGYRCRQRTNSDAGR